MHSAEIAAAPASRCNLDVIGMSVDSPLIAFSIAKMWKFYGAAMSD
jgi:hypothetical protein